MEENNNVVQNDVIINEPENNVNNENKGNGSKKGLVIIIALLILIIAGLLVYIFVIKGDDKDKDTNNTNNTNNSETNNNNNTNNNDNNNQTNNNTESRNLTAQEQADLINMIDVYGLDSLASKVDGKISGVSNRLLLNSTYSKYFNQDDIFITSYNASDIAKYFKEAFNITVTDFTDITCPLDNEVMYKYNAADNTYTYNEDHPGHGGEVVPRDDAHYIVKTNTDGELYTMDIIFVYGSLLDGYYINGKELDLSLTGYTDETPSEEVHDMVIKYFNNHKTEFNDGDIYEYTFKKNNDKFYLYSIKTVSNN